MSRTAARPTSLPRTLGRLALGGALAFAGTTHLTVAREEFQAQVPTWVPLDDDTVVLASGVAEITLGALLVTQAKRRVLVGWLAAAFFVAIFPGNVSQLVNRVDAFGLDTDAKRWGRLPFQAVLIALSLWSTGAWRDRRSLRRR